ncbi:hypothetical protein [Maribacter sp.]|uniref:Rieske (2Fe-2S) protein n=1 Tax=Maribacter sp. TaxID=1897614 RepID=UPI0032989422
MMKRLTIVILLIITACSNDGTNRNPFLQEIGFRFEANLNLPSYSPLTNTGSAIYIPSDLAGTRGVFVINSGFDQFRAFEGSCPNHAPNDCSTMELDGQIAICSCEDYQYSLFTGQLLNTPEDENRYYNMLEYRAVLSGGSVIISN